MENLFHSQEYDVWDKSVKVEENLYYWNRQPLILRNQSSLITTKPKVVELFSGCGGTSLGFELAGFDISLGLDIHQPSIETFKKNHPHATTILGDIRNVDANKIADILNFGSLDVLIGGIPCQGFSLNNRKRHEKDERNFLYQEFIKFVEILQPKIVVMENVSGMRSTANGDFVREIEAELSRVGKMKVKSKMLFAPDYGVPQKRNRLVFVGIRDDEFDFDSIEQTHGESIGKPYVTIREAIGDLPSLKVGQGKTKYKCEPFSEYQKLMRENAPIKLNNHVAPKHPQETIDKIANTKQGEPMYPKFKQRIRLKWEDLSPTQVSGGIRPQFQFGHPEDSRGLSIRERCRLQSFPDNFEVCGGVVQGRVQTGNAVPPLLAKAVALAVKKYL
jgi:DNA (cytosine-5)-methyltransferase 1